MKIQSHTSGRMNSGRVTDGGWRRSAWSVVRLPLVACVLWIAGASLTGAEDRNPDDASINQALTRQMREDHARALQLQRNEHRLEDALTLLEKYDGTEAVPEELRLQVLGFRVWGTFAARQYDQSLALFHQLLDLTVPNGWSKNLNIAYGPDERHRLDLYLPGAATDPVPVLVLIHGGGWAHGSHTRYPIMQRELVRQVLARGGAVASITYRFVHEEHKLPAPLHDSARAVQFLRAHAAQHNLDKNRFVAMGDSAGGCNTLWLATHDDLADPEADDPVLRESSRLQGAVAGAAQTTVDPADMKAGMILDALKHGMFANGLKTSRQKLQALDVNAETQALIEYCSPVKHLDAGDPPIFLSYVGPLDRDGGVHHPRLGLLFKQRADAVGARCTLSIRHEPDYPTFPPDTPLKLLKLESKLCRDAVQNGDQTE